MFYKRHCYEKEKGSHRLVENICKTHIWWRTCIQNMHRTLKTQNLKNKSRQSVCTETSPGTQTDIWGDSQHLMFSADGKLPRCPMGTRKIPKGGKRLLLVRTWSSRNSRCSGGNGTCTATQRAAWRFFQSRPLWPYNPAVALLGIYPTGLKTCVPTNVYIKMCIAAFTVIVKNWEQVRRFQYMNEYMDCGFAKQRPIIWQQQQNKLSSHVETWWFLNSCGLVKERSLKMAHAVWFDLNDILEKANYRDRLENKSLVVKGSRSGRVR